MSGKRKLRKRGTCDCAALYPKDIEYDEDKRGCTYKLSGFPRQPYTECRRMRTKTTEAR